MAGRPESIETTETTSVEPKPAETILCWLKPAETRTGHLEVLVSGGLFLCFVTCVAMVVCFFFVGDAALGFPGHADVLQSKQVIVSGHLRCENIGIETC